MSAVHGRFCNPSNGDNPVLGWTKDRVQVCGLELLSEGPFVDSKLYPSTYKGIKVLRGGLDPVPLVAEE